MGPKIKKVYITGIFKLFKPCKYIEVFGDNDMEDGSTFYEYSKVATYKVLPHNALNVRFPFLYMISISINKCLNNVN